VKGEYMNKNYNFDTFGIINKLRLDIENNPKDATIYLVESIIGYFKNEGYNQNEIDRGKELFDKYSDEEKKDTKELTKICQKDPRGFSAFIYLKVFKDEWKDMTESDWIH
jgi:hypothetical protein